MPYNANFNGFFKTMRGGKDLFHRDPQVFLLLTYIAFEAKWTDSKFGDGKLGIGEAFIPGPKALGWTEQVYRDAKFRAEFKYKLARFRRTNRGTIATLTNSDVYDLNFKSEERTKERAENGQRTDTTLLHEEGKKERKKIHVATNDSAPLRRVVATPPFFNFEIRAWQGIESRDITGWQEAYPAVDIDGELKRMAEWLLANPTRRKKNYRLFIIKWLEKQQDSPRNPLMNSATRTVYETLGSVLNEYNLGSYNYSSEFGSFELRSSTGYSKFKCSSSDFSTIRRELDKLKLRKVSV